MKPEKERVISPELIEIKFTADGELMKKLTRVKEVLAHVNPNLTYTELLHKLTDEFLERKDPVKKAERVVNKSRALSGEQALSLKNPTEPFQISPPAGFAPIPKSSRAPRYISSPIRHEVWLRDQGKCTYQDPQTNHTCNSKFGLELDHVKPHSAGGVNTVDNLRLRCKQHNTLHAMKTVVVFK